MTQDLWTAVDNYIVDTLLPPDEHLTAAVRASDVVAVLGYYSFIAMTMKAFAMMPEGVADPFADRLVGVVDLDPELAELLGE